MLYEICKYIRNFFEREKYFGTFKIEDGHLTFLDGTALPLLDGQYFRIIDSTFNDGIFQFPPNGQQLHDEQFSGAVWALAIPKEIIDLAEEIAEWQSLYGGADSTVNSPYSSESFDGYSYSKSTGSATDGAAGGSPGDWRGVYGSRLNIWRRL